MLLRQKLVTSLFLRKIKHSILQFSVASFKLFLWKRLLYVLTKARSLSFICHYLQKKLMKEKWYHLKLFSKMYND